ncbi:hypothetical protein GDO86_015699 [Hymenochirus boettgeri]|uniref:Uncharacterized protein n=1 Tax=Hymenochirus boettgeri TaxID=247094 RepID=A0A8T2JU13_9PIPI|nr:hypothetical protein GDO86_015699 [Hymenochirus boettgeri]
MARPLYDGSPSEPVQNIQGENNNAFPAGVANNTCDGICEQNVPLSNQTNIIHLQPSSYQRCHCQINREAQSNCEESELCGQSLFPATFNTGETTAISLTHSGSDTSGMDTDVYVPEQNDSVGASQDGALLLVMEENLEREIALRLRRIGDQMNELYLQRRFVGEQHHWWGPLRWHLTQFISEILAALYNPLVDILPHH